MSFRLGIPKVENSRRQQPRPLVSTLKHDADTPNKWMFIIETAALLLWKANTSGPAEGGTINIQAHSKANKGANYRLVCAK